MTLPVLPQIPKSLDNFADQTVNPVARGFVDWVLLKLGLSEEVLRAKDRVEAKKIDKKGELELPYIIQLEVKKLERQYSNLGIILQKMTPLVTAQKPQIKDDNDFFWGLLEHSKEISNKEMQELISKILAGEYNVPGTYDMSTLQTIKMLGQKELQLLERICNLLVDKERLPQNLFTGQDNAKELLKEIEIDFRRFQSLQSLGLFLPNDMSKTIANQSKMDLEISYFDKKLIYIPENDNYASIKLPDFYGLTPVGLQILTHLDQEYINKYFVWLKENYKISNYKLKE